MLHLYLLACLDRFICIFDRSATSLPSITDHHHWLRPRHLEVARSLISTVSFALKDEVIYSGLMKVDNVSHYVVAVLWLDSICGKLCILHKFYYLYIIKVPLSGAGVLSLIHPD